MTRVQDTTPPNGPFGLWLTGRLGPELDKAGVTAGKDKQQP